MKFEPKTYQRKAAHFMASREYAGLFADPGLGKTVVALSVLRGLLKKGEVKHPLIIAPLRVALLTWPGEIAKWDHTATMSCNVMHGTDKAIDFSKDLHIINPEGLKWLFEQRESKHFDCLVIDESTKFKNWAAKRVRNLKKRLGQFHHRYILTGTPAPNGLLDLFAQVHLLDKGASLGRGITRYKDSYFQPVDFRRFAWVPRVGAADEIERKIAPFCLRLDGEHLLELPDFIYHNFEVDLSPTARKKYDLAEKEMFLELEAGEGEIIPTAAAKYGIARQIVSGAVYDETGSKNFIELHQDKINCLLDVLDELGGKPAIVVYHYRHELTRLQKAIPNAPHLGAGCTAQQIKEGVQAWNNGAIQVLLAQSSSIAHGLNLQYGPGRHVIWYTLTDNLEDYLQLNRRIRRQGVTGNVFVYHLLARNTIDEAVKKRLDKKDGTQQGLLDALREYHNAKTSTGQRRQSL